MYLSLGTHICVYYIKPSDNNISTAEYTHYNYCLFVKGGPPGQISFTPLTHYCYHIIHTVSVVADLTTACTQIFKSTENRPSEFLIFFFIFYTIAIEYEALYRQTRALQ